MIVSFSADDEHEEAALLVSGSCPEDSDFARSYAASCLDNTVEAIRERVWVLAGFRCPLEFMKVSENEVVYLIGPTRTDYAGLSDDC